MGLEKKIVVIMGVVLLPFISNCQNLDTLELIVNYPSKKNFSYGDKKIFIKDIDGSLIKDQIVVQDSIMDLRSKSANNMVYLKLFNRRGKLYSSGFWNEEGYSDKIFIYRKNGAIKYSGRFNNGEFIRDEK